MKSGRFFVTTVVLLAMAAAAACDRKRDHQPKNQQEINAKTTADKAALVNEGNAKIAEAKAIQDKLAADGVTIAGSSKGLRDQAARAKDLNDKLATLTAEARRSLQGRLAQYLQLINRVIEIDSKNLITIDNRDMIYTSRNSAELLQKNIEEYQAAHGENSEPKVETPAPQKRAENN